MDKRSIAAALLLLSLAAGVREGLAAPPAAPPPPPAEEEARGKKAHIHKGAVHDVDPEEGWLVLRAAGSGKLLSIPAAPRVPLDNLKAGDNVAVTVKDGQAVSIRPFRVVPKSLRTLPYRKSWKVIESPAVPAGTAPSRSPSPGGAAPPRTPPPPPRN